ncbi:MAG: TrmH family RNA methyltransferase [Eubacterium sp.]
MIITSSSNEQIKNIIQLKEKSKVRKNKKMFTVEGIKMFQEIPRDDLVGIFVSETFERENRKMLSGRAYQTVSDSVFKKISDTVTPQGIMAIVKQKEYTIDAIIDNRNNNKSCIVVLDRLQDPGNLGTIIRTGEGAGISGIVMSSDCADVYNPKVIRSTMGSIFRVPFTCVENLPEAVDRLKKSGVTVYAAHLDGEIYSSGNLAKDCAFLIGNEARGLSDQVSAKADRLIKIPMAGKVESLNAAVATAILMYEAAK